MNIYETMGLSGADYMRPRITGLSATKGLTTGGETITITGAGFTGSTWTLDGAAVTPTIVSDTSATLVMPAHAAGAVALAVTLGAVTWTQNKAYEYASLYSAPSAPTGLTVTALSSTSLYISWLWSALATKFELERASSYSGVYSKIVDVTIGTYYTNTGLTVATTYYYRVRAYNDQGYSSYSDIANGTTFVTASVPSSTIATDLSQSIRNAILEITSFTSANVIIGEIDDFQVRDGSTGYPCCGILYLGNSGGQYYDQRNINCNYKFALTLHSYATTEDRDDGTDQTTISTLVSSVERQLYRFMDKSQSNAPPCTGYRSTNPDFNSELFYEIFSEHVNSGVIEISFNVDASDTSI